MIRTDRSGHWLQMYLSWARLSLSFALFWTCLSQVCCKNDYPMPCVNRQWHHGSQLFQWEMEQDYVHDWSIPVATRITCYRLDPFHLLGSAICEKSFRRLSWPTEFLGQKQRQKWSSTTRWCWPSCWTKMNRVSRFMIQINENCFCGNLISLLTNTCSISMNYLGENHILCWIVAYSLFSK